MQEVVEGRQRQSVDEEICYKITTTNWGSDPTGVSVLAHVGEDINTAITATIFPDNTPDVTGDVITLSPLKNLVKNVTYKIDVKFTVAPNTFECFFYVEAV